MKHALIIVFFCAISMFKGQENTPLSYSEVVKLSDSTKSSKLLYASAKMWFTQTFKDPKEVIILDDPTNNIIVGRGNMRYNSKIFSGSAARQGWIGFDVQIACKDGRYKYNFSNFTHEGKSYNYGLITNDPFLPTMKGIMMGGPENYKIKVTNELKETVKNRIESLIVNLETTMEKPLTTKEEW